MRVNELPKPEAYSPQLWLKATKMAGDNHDERCSSCKKPASTVLSASYINRVGGRARRYFCEPCASRLPKLLRPVPS